MHGAVGWKAEAMPKDISEFRHPFFAEYVNVIHTTIDVNSKFPCAYARNLIRADWEREGYSKNIRLAVYQDPLGNINTFVRDFEAVFGEVIEHSYTRPHPTFVSWGCPKILYRYFSYWALSSVDVLYADMLNVYIRPKLCFRHFLRHIYLNFSGLRRNSGGPSGSISIESGNSPYQSTDYAGVELVYGSVCGAPLLARVGIILAWTWIALIVVFRGLGILLDFTSRQAALGVRRGWDWPHVYGSVLVSTGLLGFFVGLWVVRYFSECPG